MRKLILALTALACLVAPAGAQQAPSFSIYGPLPAGSNAIGSVLADLRVAGSPVTTGNPIPVGGTVILGSGSATIGSVNVLGGNATAVKTDGSAVTQPVSAASLPLPAGAATSANQSSIITSLGGTGDAAYTGSGTASLIAGLKGIYNATLAPLATGANLIGKVGIDQTTPGTTNGVVVNSSALPSNAATSTNQASEIAALGSIAQRAVLYSDTGSQSLAASASFSGPVRDAGTSPTYTRLNALAYSNNQVVTLTIRGCFDSGCASNVPVGSVTVPAGGANSVSVPLVTRWYQVNALNTSSSGGTTVIVSSSFTAN